MPEPGAGVMVPAPPEVLTLPDLQVDYRAPGPASRSFSEYDPRASAGSRREGSMADRTSNAVLDELDARIAAGPILGHPFYPRWRARALTRQDLAIYARAYYPHVAAFPEYLEAAAERAELPAVRAEVRA